MKVTKAGEAEGWGGCCWGEGGILEECSALGMAVLAFYGVLGTEVTAGWEENRCC